jgi:hypothetical protein
MVLKKEGTHHMCPDFWALVNLMSKDKFPILVIDDDLLDELHGAKIFTKLDLQYGYQQIMMKEEDIPKIYFHTHEYDYEFLVIPFNFCNAPSTF